MPYHCNFESNIIKELFMKGLLKVCLMRKRPFLQLISWEFKFFHIINIICKNKKKYLIMQVLDRVTHPKFPIKMISFKKFNNVFMFAF